VFEARNRATVAAADKGTNDDPWRIVIEGHRACLGREITVVPEDGDVSLRAAANNSARRQARARDDPH
jgi:hypothetical protein